MQTQKILKALVDQNIIPIPQAQLIQKSESDQPFSVYRELRFLLYTGILLCLSGVSLIVYNHIDQIGHTLIIAVIALCTSGCFYYAFYKREPHRSGSASTAQTIQDYILLLGCSLFLILEGYLQFQYQIFGNQYGLATLLPTVLFFASAYYFDHKGVLTLAIMGLASWVGLTIAPGKILNNDFNDPSIILTGTCLGIALIVFGLVSDHWKCKRHFVFTYLLTGSIVALVFITMAIFGDHYKYVYALASFLLCLFLAWLAFSRGEFIFILLGIIAAYILVTYLAFHLLFRQASSSVFLMYYAFSSFLVLYVLIKILNVFKNNKSKI